RVKPGGPILDFLAVLPAAIVRDEPYGSVGHRLAVQGDVHGYRILAIRVFLPATAYRGPGNHGQEQAGRQHRWSSVALGNGLDPAESFAVVSGGEPTEHVEWGRVGQEAHGAISEQDIHAAGVRGAEREVLTWAGRDAGQEITSVVAVG